MTSHEILEFATPFWEWFTSNSCILADLHDREEKQDIAKMVADQFTQQKLDLGWEMGVDVEGHRYFALSPKMSSELLILTRGMVENCPGLEGWTFYPTRPRRAYTPDIEFSNARGQHVKLDLSNWQYYLRLYPEDRQFDLVLVAASLPPMDSNARLRIALTIAQGLLGEGMCIENLDSLEIVDSVEEEIKPDLTHIRYLYDHIRSLGFSDNG